MLFGFVACLALVGLLEGVLRIAGLPTGRFGIVFEERDLLYAPSQRRIARWGSVEYVVETNAFGMRSPEIALKKPPGVTRIATVGDSVTDGFFVDNDQTYPAWLLRTLVENGFRVEVLNAAKAGGTIDRQLRIVRRIAPLAPDVVLITFVTNDIADLLKMTRADLLDPEPQRSAPFLQSLFGSTAIGELAFSTYLRMRSTAPPITAPSHQDRPQVGDGRYDIPGGIAFEDNAKAFFRRYGDTDGLVLQQQASAAVEVGIQNYFVVLEAVHELCRQLGVELVLAYYPAYPEIYDELTPSIMRSRLAQWCVNQRVRFLDLTMTFRKQPRERALHLAPVDFHLNPEGNRVLGEAVAKFLIAERLVGDR